MKMKIAFLLLAFVPAAVLASQEMGSAQAEKQSELALEEMLQYAMEDEHLALAEYEAIMEEYGEHRPYANIAESEKVHISYLTALYERYGMEVPLVLTEGHVVIPENLEAAAEIGIQAEIANMGMYQKFLEQELPSDVREVFQFLMKASENHLRAFERQTTGGTGRFGHR